MAAASSSQNDPLGPAFDAENFRRLAHGIVDQLADHLAQVQDRHQPVLTWEAPEIAAAHWQKHLSETTSSPENLGVLVTILLRDAFRAHHPRNLGHQVSPVLPLAAIADFVANLLDTGSGVYELGNPGTAMERATLSRLAALIGFPLEADGVLTSGGSLGNLTALLAMRQSRLQDAQAENSRNDPHQYAVLVSEEAHYSIDRALKIMGFDAGKAVSVPVDAHFQLRASSLAKALARAATVGREVIGVVACAGSTGTGRIDALPEIADFCEQHQLWLHVDAAHSGGFVFSRRARPWLAGLERADSVVIDFHKMLLSSSLLTAVLYKRGRDSYRPFAQKADYLWSTDRPGEWWDGAKRTLECTRPMLGVRAYALLACAGEPLLEAYIDHALDAAAVFASLLEEAEDFDLLIRPQSNILCYRYRPADLDETSVDALNRRIRAQLVREGRFYIVQIEKRQRVYLRSALMHPFASRTVFEELMDEIRRVAASLGSPIQSEG